MAFLWGRLKDGWRRKIFSFSASSFPLCSNDFSPCVRADKRCRKSNRRESLGDASLVQFATWATMMPEILRAERKTNVAHLSDVLSSRGLAPWRKEINFTWTRKHTQIRDDVSRAFYSRLKYRRASLRWRMSDLCESCRRSTSSLCKLTRFMQFKSDKVLNSLTFSTWFSFVFPLYFNFCFLCIWKFEPCFSCWLHKRPQKASRAISITQDIIIEFYSDRAENKSARPRKLGKFEFLVKETEKANIFMAHEVNAIVSSPFLWE